MISLQRLTVDGFLSLHEVDVTFGDLNVLVGPNGAGKTNLLRAIQFLGDVVRHDLEGALESSGNFDRLLFAGDVEPRPTRFRFQTWAQSAEGETYYGLLVSETKSGLRRTERLKLKRREKVVGKFDAREGIVRGSSASVDVNQPIQPFSAAISTLPRLKLDDWIGELAEFFETIRVFEPDPVLTGFASRIEKSPVLDDEARNLAPYLFWLSEADPEAFKLLQRDLRYVLPGFESLSFEQIGGSVRSVEVMFKESGMLEPLPLGDASLGTLRGLAILALLHDPNPPALTCVDEIDYGLHPYALDIVVERMRSASERTQLIVSTHSPSLVNRLRPSELIVCERDDETGASIIPAIDPKEVAGMAEDSGLRLGELWFSGALGGVPE